MSEYTVVESKKARKASRKSTTKSSSTVDEYDKALDIIDRENNQTYQKIKSMIASQVSDTVGLDVSLLSTPELIARGRMVITKDNPTGQPPGLNVKEPTMFQC